MGRPPALCAPGIQVSLASYAAAQILKLLPRTQVSRVVGRLCEQPLPPAVSRAVAKAYIQAFGVDMRDVAPMVGPYASFDAFFTRPLRDGARHLDESPLVSPADGVLVDRGRIDEEIRIAVKKRQYSVADLIGDAEEAEQYRGGTYGVVYLSPRDYHRVHSPFDGRLHHVRAMPGDLYPVNAIGERYVPRLFVRNRRVAMLFDTEDIGRAAVVMVGAFIVGRMTVTALNGVPLEAGERRIDPPRAVRRGDEIGIFHLGSTVVFLVERGIELSRPAGPVRYGQSLLDGS